MIINFVKMQGIGNDFVVIDAIHQKIALSREQIRHIANRHYGVGCDQLLLVESSERKDAEFFYRIFNADGSEAAQCGNGARCFARFVTDEGMTDSQIIPVETQSGLIQLQLEADGRVTVDMGEPNFNPASLPFKTKTTAEYHELLVNDEKYAIGVVSMGNPHAVLLVESVKDAPVHSLGAAIEAHTSFPQRVNVGFMQIEDRSNIRLRVYERGAGETMACGTGACAAVAIGIKNRLLDECVQVELRGGDLTINWPGIGEHLMMTGPAENVYKGQIEL